jgi:predicted transcriptional regulator
MGVLWARGSATVREIATDLGEQRKLAYTTVLTLVSRLWMRGLLLREPEGRGFRYTPAKTRDQLLSDLSNELIDRLLEDFGDVAVAQLGRRLDRLDPERVRKLRQGTDSA